jgi:hypothetical protein
LVRDEDVDLAELLNFPIAALLNFRAARRAASLPPWTESLNIFVTAVAPRRKCTWKPWVCFFARGFVSIRRMFVSELGLGRLRMRNSN